MRVANEGAKARSDQRNLTQTLAWLIWLIYRGKVTQTENGSVQPLRGRRGSGGDRFSEWTTGVTTKAA